MNHETHESHEIENAKGQFLVYQAEDGSLKLDVRLEGETVWLSQRLMAELFQKDVRTINHHIQSIYEEGELDAAPTIRKYRIVQITEDTINSFYFLFLFVIFVYFVVETGDNNDKLTKQDGKSLDMMNGNLKALKTFTEDLSTSGDGQAGGVDCKTENIDLKA